MHTPLRSIAVALVACSLASTGFAQTSTTEPAAHAVNFLPAQSSALAADGASSTRRVMADVDRKDPTLAGVLSFLIPGVGSLYAGNTTHGIMHLGIHVASYAVMIGGAATSCDIYSDCSSNGAMIGLGALALLGNDVWSIFTAVNDAHAHNGDNGAAKPGRVVGSLYVDPAVEPVGHSVEGTRSSRALRLLSIHF